MSRRNRDTSFGRKGGEGPNRGKKAVTYTATAPNGTVLRRRFFDLVSPVETGIAAVLVPHNGHGWHLWAVAATKEELPSYVPRDSEMVIFISCQRVSR